MLINRNYRRVSFGGAVSVVVPANRLGSIVSSALAGVLVSTVLRQVNADVPGIHIGRLDYVFTVGGLIAALFGVYFGLASRRPVPPDLVPTPTPAPTVAGS